jgi:gamma-glutamyltranspeptidase
VELTDSVPVHRRHGGSLVGNRLTDGPNPVRALHGIATAPHVLAAQSAAAILREGGNAIEAIIAAAATIAVAYPHMNSIGGDGFWLIARPGSDPVGIEASGAAARSATIESYRERGFAAIPVRGPLAASTMAGTVSGWELAQQWSRDALRGSLPLSRLLDDAIGFARDGVPVTRGQAQCVAAKRSELE